MVACSFQSVFRLSFMVDFAVSRQGCFVSLGEPDETARIHHFAKRYSACSPGPGACAAEGEIATGCDNRCDRHDPPAAPSANLCGSRTTLEGLPPRFSHRSWSRRVGC